jgi:hypothetical protein
MSYGAEGVDKDLIRKEHLINRDEALERHNLDDAVFVAAMERLTSDPQGVQERQ